MSDQPGDTQLSLLEKISRIFLDVPSNRSELIELLKKSQKRNLFDIDALTMIEGVFEVAEIQARDIMVPRSHMAVLELEHDYETMLAVVVDSGHSRFPVIGDGRDEIVGILLAKDLLRYCNAEERKNFEIKDVLRPPIFVPESKRLNVLLKEFRSSRNHMAIVVDEYGGVAGLVTIEDVLEQIVGEIDDEHDDADAANIRRLAANRYSLKALTDIKEFNEYFDSGLNDDECDTIGGLIMQHLGHMPKRGESVQIERFLFKVMSADSRRIKHLQMVLLPVPNKPAEE